MKVNTYIFTLLIILTTLVACEQTIDLELPAYENDLVLYGVLIAGEQPQIVVTESTGYFEPLNNRDRVKVINNAQVTLNDGEATYELWFDDNMTNYTFYAEIQNGEWGRDSLSLGGYTNNMTIEAGKTYSIEIKHAGRTITGETTVPKKININSASYEIEEFNDPFYGGSTCYQDKKEVNFDDADEENFYQLVANVDRWSFKYCDQFVDGTIIEIDSCSRGKNDRFYPILSDETFNGTNYTYQLYPGFIDCIGGGYRPDTLIELRGYSIYKFALHSVSKELFDFNNSLAMQRNSEDNPFQEPSTIKSTVEGGVGVFASKSAPSDTVVLRVDELY